MDVIDFRMRPLYKGYCSMVENKTTDKFLQALRCEPSPSIIRRSLNILIDEMDQAGIDLAVIPGRQTEKTYISNDELMEIKQSYPERFEIFPLYNPMKPEENLMEIRQYLEAGICCGVTTEPGFGNSYRFDDEVYTPLYELLNDRNAVWMTTFSGSITPTLDMSLPGRFQSVAKKYPNIKAVAGHGGWPWVREMISIAFFTPNVYLAPDLYAVRCAGSDDYRAAAEGMLREQFLFGSSYPLVPVNEAVNCVKSWGLDSETEKKVLFGNAAKLLGIENK